LNGDRPNDLKFVVDKEGFLQAKHASDFSMRSPNDVHDDVSVVETEAKGEADVVVQQIRVDMNVVAKTQQVITQVQDYIIVSERSIENFLHFDFELFGI
jgi:hypothetical protein